MIEASKATKFKNTSKKYKVNDKEEENIEKEIELRVGSAHDM